MFSSSIFQKIIGGWIDTDVNEKSQEVLNVSGETFNEAKKMFENENVAQAAEILKVPEGSLQDTIDLVVLESGQQTLETMTIFPAILIVLFTFLYFWMRKRDSRQMAKAQTGIESTAL